MAERTADLHTILSDSPRDLSLVRSISEIVSSPGSRYLSL